MITNIILLISGEYYAAATGLLFGFTYLFIGFNAVFGLDGRVLGWFSLFVAVNTVPPSVLSLLKDHDPLFFCNMACLGCDVVAHDCRKCFEKRFKKHCPDFADCGRHFHRMASGMVFAAGHFIMLLKDCFVQ